jgi:hypothetical protein
MARPRVFLSSTFYDLRYIRNDLERFIKETGYEPVMSERGHIAYGHMDRLEEYCYREISTCDILVHIVGGKYGSQSHKEPYSVSQMELKTAHDLHKQIYVFVERTVHVEYRTFLKNEDNKSFLPQYVDNLEIYNFLKKIYGLPSNNVIADFDSVNEIIEYLREQWAGLFQRFLQETSRREDYKISSNLKSTAETLAKLIQYTTAERDQTIKSILVYNHPVFSQLAGATNIPIRIFFSNYDELAQLLDTFGFIREIDFSTDDCIFERIKSGTKTTVYISLDIFDDSLSLKPVESGEWDREFVRYRVEEGLPDDDIPF